MSVTLGAHQAGDYDGVMENMSATAGAPGEGQTDRRTDGLYVFRHTVALPSSLLHVIVSTSTSHLRKYTRRVRTPPQIVPSRLHQSPRRGPGTRSLLCGSFLTLCSPPSSPSTRSKSLAYGAVSCLARFVLKTLHERRAVPGVLRPLSAAAACCVCASVFSWAQKFTDRLSSHARRSRR